jgi:TldD protein
VTFQSQEKALATTDGTWVTQRSVLGAGKFSFNLVNAAGTAAAGRDLGETLFTPQGRGWEIFRDADARGEIQRLLEEMRAELALPTKPVEVGRYGAVLDAISMARLLDATLGRATELDRAMGYEANAGGTSYIDRPLEMAGSYEAASKLVSVRANRDESGAAATVGWDDEGVPAGRFDLVRDGVLVDFQTTREGAGRLDEYYAKERMKRGSRGCAAAPTALEAPMTHTANLSLVPSATVGGFDTLCQSLGDGVAFQRATFDLDWQASSGVGSGSALEVKGGKPVARLIGAGMLFRATDLWKSVRALGGAGSAMRFGLRAEKGEPEQERVHSVSAVPALLEGLTIIDPRRKA